MKTEITIKKIAKEMVIADNQEQLAVTIAILEDGEEVVTRKVGFPLDTPEKEIKAELAKALKTHLSDKEVGERSAKLEEDNKKADKTIKNLTGLKL